MSTLKRLGLLTILLASIGTPAGAAFTVAPNIYASTEAPVGLNGPLQAGPITLQFGLPASQFGAIPIGNQITSIDFRLDGGSTTVTSALFFSQYNIQIGQPTTSIAGLSSTFAANEGPDTVLVRSGSLTIPAGSLVGGVGPNPFFDITFSTPYTYKGGDVLVTLTHTGNGSIGVTNDAFSVGPLGNSVLDNSFGSTTGLANFFNVPVVRFGFGAAAVPEPSSVALCGIAGLVGLAYSRARRRPASA